jgi:hypothetical protein
MNQDEYIEQRLDDQINWYSRKSGVNQKKYKTWQVIRVIAALLIPILTLFVNEFPEFTYVIGTLGAVIVFIESFIKIFNYKEVWITYRMTSEQLKREKILYLTKCYPYDNSNAFEILVQKCEAIMNSENFGWKEIVFKKKESEDDQKEKQ